MKLRSSLKIVGIVFSVLLAFGLGEKAANGQTVNQTAIVFTNNTGLPDDAVYLNVESSLDNTNTYGNGSLFLTQGSYSLAQLMGTVSGTNLGTIPTIQIGNTSGARFDLTLGATTPAANESVVSGYFETTTFSGTTNVYNNLDISYVDGAGLPLSFSVNNRSDNSAISLPNQTNPILTNGGSLVTSLTSDPEVPANAQVTNTYLAPSSSGTYIISGTTYVASPTNNTLPQNSTNFPAYHDWSTNVTDTSGTVIHQSLINTLESSSQTISVASYVTTTSSPSPALPAGVTFGYNGTAYSSGAAYSPFNPTNSATSADPNNLFLASQSYAMTGTYKTDITSGLTPTQIAALTASNPGIVAGTPGLVMTGTGGSVGTFTIYITQAQINANGLYGGNPQYTLMWTPTSGPDSGVTQYATQAGSNNLVDRIVGDVASGTTWGWAASTTVIGAHAIATGTQAALAGTVFDATNGVLRNLTVGQLSTGQYIYLLSLEGLNQQAWSGAGIDPTNPLLYANYISNITGLTGGYTGPYTDRLVGVSPDIYYTPGALNNPVNGLYINVTLEASGSYSVTVVPEPGTWALLGFGLLFLGVHAYRKRRQRQA